MPHIFRDVNPIVATLLTQRHFFYDRAIIIVSSHPNLASQDNERLILCWVPMDGYHSPWLHGIEHPMSLILQRLIKRPMTDTINTHPSCPSSYALSMFVFAKLSPCICQNILLQLTIRSIRNCHFYIFAQNRVYILLLHFITVA